MVVTERRTKEKDTRSDRALPVVAVALMLVATLPAVHADAPTQETTKLMASNRSQGDEFGVSLDAAADRIIVGQTEPGNLGSAYLYARDTLGAWSQTAMFVPIGSGAGDGIGHAVAVDGDRVFVGAMNHDVHGLWSGAVFVFEPDGFGAWAQTKVAPSDGQAEDWFGSSIAADGGRFVVGARGDDDGANAAGSVYLFEPDGNGGWTETKLTASDGANSDLFGQRVALHGDRIVVGVPNDDDLGVGSGSVYVYEADGIGGWTETKITASDGAGSDMFGDAVAVHGDRIVVGVYRDDDKGINAGAIYIYEPDGSGGWVETKLTASDGTSTDSFGYHVAVHEDLVLAGARTDDVGGTNTGSAYLYEADGAGGWRETKLVASDAASPDLFGQTVALAAGFAAIGAPNVQDMGAVYVLEPPTSPPQVPQDDGGTGGDASNDPADPTPIPVGEESFHVNGTVAPETDEIDAYALSFGTSADNVSMAFTPPAWADIEVRLISPSAQTHVFDSAGLGGTESVHIPDEDMEAGVWTLVVTLKSASVGLPPLGTGLLDNDLVHYRGGGVCAPKCRP